VHDIDIPPRCINEVVHGKRAVTVDIALRLARSFDTSEALWMGLQVDYDLEEAREGQGDILVRKAQSRAD
jgi:addiction module HigA family antidote